MITSRYLMLVKMSGRRKCFDSIKKLKRILVKSLNINILKQHLAVQVRFI